MSTREFEGWSPSGKIVEDKIIFEPRFDEFDVQAFMALEEIEADTCPGCGGYLSETTVKDHGYHIDERECQKCAAMHRYHRQRDKIAEVVEGTSLEIVPAARRLYLTKIEIPDDLINMADEV